MREDADLSQEKLAQILGIRQTVYSRYERGYQTIPLPLLIQLADYYQGDVYSDSADYSNIRDSSVYSDSWDYSSSNNSSWGSRSSSSYDDDDDDWDWDSGSDWDSDDSWDSGSTDWGSDW